MTAIRTIALAGLLAALGLSGCADDCEVICGKLQFCELLPDLSLRSCVDRCEDRQASVGDATNLCADCLDQTSCRVIGEQACAEPCTPVVSSGDPGGQGGAGGGGGAAGEGGTEAVGGAPGP